MLEKGNSGWVGCVLTICLAIMLGDIFAAEATLAGKKRLTNAKALSPIKYNLLCFTVFSKLLTSSERLHCQLRRRPLQPSNQLSRRLQLLTFRAPWVQVS